MGYKWFRIYFLELDGTSDEIAYLVPSIKMLNISFLLHLFPIAHHHHQHGTHLIGKAHWSAGDPKHGSTGVPGSNDLIIKIKSSNYI